MLFPSPCWARGVSRRGAGDRRPSDVYGVAARELVHAMFANHRSVAKKGCNLGSHEVDEVHAGADIFDGSMPAESVPDRGIERRSL